MEVMDTRAGDWARAPVRSVGLTERVYEEVEAAIVACRLAPGQQLTDRGIAEELGVSRTPVREALNRLQSSGLVESRGRQGWVVTTIDMDDVRELFELRRLLEPVGIDHLAANPDPSVLAGFRAAFAHFPDDLDTDEYLDYFPADHAFHMQIVECTKNRRVLNTYQAVEKEILRGRHLLSTDYWGRSQANVKKHREIAEAIAAEDFSAARRDLVEHLFEAEAVMLEFLDKHLSEP